jgi:hypothetical protein
MDTSLMAGKAEFDRKTNVVTWNIPKMAGGTEVILRAKIVLGSVMNANDCALDEFGLVRVNFELPMLLLSGEETLNPKLYLSFPCFCSPVRRP